MLLVRAIESSIGQTESYQQWQGDVVFYDLLLVLKQKSKSSGKKCHRG